jgi:hypothetical protein
LSGDLLIQTQTTKQKRDTSNEYKEKIPKELEKLQRKPLDLNLSSSQLDISEEEVVVGEEIDPTLQSSGFVLIGGDVSNKAEDAPASKIEPHVIAPPKPIPTAAPPAAAPEPQPKKGEPAPPPKERNVLPVQPVKTSTPPSSPALVDKMLGQTINASPIKAIAPERLKEPEQLPSLPPSNPLQQSTMELSASQLATDLQIYITCGNKTKRLPLKKGFKLEELKALIFERLDEDPKVKEIAKIENQQDGVTVDNDRDCSELIHEQRLIVTLKVQTKIFTSFFVCSLIFETGQGLNCSSGLSPRISESSASYSSPAISASSTTSCSCHPSPTVSPSSTANTNYSSPAISASSTTSCSRHPSPTISSAAHKEQCFSAWI